MRWWPRSAAAWLLLLIGVVAAGAASTDPGARAQASCPGADSGPDAGVAALTEATMCLIAAERAAAGLTALTRDAALESSARGHAHDMVTRRYFSAQSPDGLGPTRRAIRAGYRTTAGASSVGEVFAFGTGSEATPRAALARWNGNPSARLVLVDPDARDLGVGVAMGTPRGDPSGATYVADFGAPSVDVVPEPGKTVVVEPIGGSVLVAPGRSRRFVPLDAGRSLPVGSRVDTRRGTVRLTASKDLGGGVQSAQFFDGMFRVTQRRTAAPVTELRLVERLAPCTSVAAAAASDAPKRKRRLWGSGKGRFRTRGTYGTATVVGTRWLVEDTCAGTLVRVRQGTVAVRDLRTGRTRRLLAGRSFLVRRP